MSNFYTGCKSLFFWEIVCFVILVAGSAGFAVEAEVGFDKSRYIGIDEIKPGMKAYCLTVYEGTKIERFELDVLKVIRDFEPGRNAILVKGTDERFIHTGPVAGCSGSPVYIEGRMAGALAFGWLFSKDALYGVTPIREMLRAGRAGETGRDNMSAYDIDFSSPVDFKKVVELVGDNQLAKPVNVGGMGVLPIPFSVSGLSQQSAGILDNLLGPAGFTVFQSAGSGGGSGEKKDIKLEPGSSLAVPLVAGDIKLSGIGTVTEVVGDKVYAFGHGMLGRGPVDLPIATGEIDTVVATLARSFKFGNYVEVVGAMRADESTAVYSLIGEKAPSISLKIKVGRFNDLEDRIYNCQVAVDRQMTPVMVQVAVTGAATMIADLPPEHMVKYKIHLEVEGFEPVSFENISTGRGLGDVIEEAVAPIALLMNNPFKQAEIKLISCEIDIQPTNISSHLWSVELSDSVVKAGDEVTVAVVVESYRGDKKRYEYRLKIPDDLQPGRYEVIVCGSPKYEEFLVNTAPYRFIANNLDDLMAIIDEILQLRRDKLYVLMQLPPKGVAVERSQLPDLPGTKTMLLLDGKRDLKVHPYQKWVEESMQIETIVAGSKVLAITVKK